MDVELSYCVLNTEQRQLLSYCLDAIARERATVDFETETLVLDNASWDGSADAARSHPVTDDVIALDVRRSRGENASELLRRARGRFCLLLDEDSELEPGATVALHAALAAADDAAAAGATLVDLEGAQRPSAFRFPSAGTALLSLVGLKRTLVQGRGSATWTGRRPPRCWCAVTWPPRSTGSAPTRWTSAGACTMPAGGCCTCPTPGPCITISNVDLR
jgi:N-acetylglucosaminyl-diphospho-decaprenol L-rhamnosyltransferase